MLIKVLHQEKGSRKLLAEFPNKAFELIIGLFNIAAKGWIEQYAISRM